MSINVNTGFVGYSKELLEKILNVGTDCVCVKDREGRFVFINEMDASLYQAKPEEMLGKTVEPWVGAEQFAQWQRDDHAVFDAGVSTHFEMYSRVGEDKITRWFETVKVPFLDQEKQRELLLIIHRDVSSIKKAHDELDALRQQITAAQKLETIGLLSASVAHDFNNMLTVIMTSARLLSNLPQINAEVSYLAETINRSVERAADVVDRLLILAQRDMGEQTMFDLNTRLLGSKHLLQAVLGEKITVRYDLSLEDLPLSGNESQMDQILINLFFNARDAMPEGGEIIIRTSLLIQGEGKPDLAVLEVRDTGSGMTEEVKNKAFDPFFTTKQTGKGSGLGLLVVKRIVEHHGGQIKVDSELGKGTVFTLSFPCQMKAQEPELTPNLFRSEAFAGKTVLLVEDEDLLSSLISMSLQSWGVKVLTSPTGEEGWDIFLRNQGKINCLILDIVLEGAMDGVTLRKKIAEVDSEVPALLISGYSFDYLDDNQPLPPRTKFLPKPFSLESLKDKITPFFCEGFDLNQISVGKRSN